MKAQEFIDNLDKISRNFAETVLDDMMDDLQVKLLNHSLDAFKKSSFDGIAWTERRDKHNKRKLLIKSGILRNSITVQRKDKYSLVVSSDVEYAEIHNEGGEINKNAMSRNSMQLRNRKGRFKKGTKAGQGFTIKAHTITIPQRQFIGHSKELDEIVENTVIDALNSIFLS